MDAIVVGVTQCTRDKRAMEDEHAMQGSSYMPITIGALIYCVQCVLNYLINMHMTMHANYRPVSLVRSVRYI